MMAHEKGQAEPECGISLRSWGWFGRKKTDAMRCTKCGSVVKPGGVSGTWDYPQVYVPLWSEHRAIYLDIEVKASGTSLAFSRLEPDQRQWAKDNSERPKWLWVCIGKGAVNASEKPRRTYFLPYVVFLAIERELSPKRKSIPYGHPVLDKWELKWEGHKTWSIPAEHPVRTADRYL